VSESDDSIPAETSIPLIYALTPSAVPTSPLASTLSPEIDEVLRWKEYEDALGELLLGFLPRGKYICEWEVLGRSEFERYLWAVCTGTVTIGELSSHYPSAEMPVLVHTEMGGAIRSMEIPGAGTLYAEDIRRMFPEYVQTRIFKDQIDYSRLSDHLILRRVDLNEPPLIAIDATQMP
jgi:hypothetical protein